MRTGKTQYPYWHILLRPAGSINASANDMAAYLQFYLNRGSVSGKQIFFRASDIDPMEIPESTWSAKEGLKGGYGLNNYWSIEDGFVYHGHDGGVEGGITNMAYMPDNGVGYFFSMNSGNGAAFDKIAKAIRAYITKTLQKPEVPAVGSLPTNASDYAGWYEPNAPRVQLTHFIDRLAGITWIQVKDGHLTLLSLGGKEIFVPVFGAQFRHLQEGCAHSVPSLELLSPMPEGRFIQTATMSTFKKLPTWLALAEILIMLYVLLAVIAILIYAPFWILGGLSRRRRRPAERLIRLFPLLAVLSLLGFIAIFIVCSDDLIARMGNRTFWSVALEFTTLAFVISVFFERYRLVARSSRGRCSRPGVRRFSRLVTIALLICAAYLGYWGIINLRTWA